MDRNTEIKNIKDKFFHLDDATVARAVDLIEHRAEIVKIMGTFPPFSQAWRLCSKKITDFEVALYAIEPGLVI